MDTILVTGGAGYIGSHTIVELLNAGFAAVSLDNYSNSSQESLRRVERITGRSVVAIDGDIRDASLLDRVLSEHAISGVCHFAALKAVGESVAQPLRYYENNVVGSLTLIDALQRSGPKPFIFSSSATVYGTPDTLPLEESAPIRPANPYGSTKAMIEQILRDVAAAEPAWSVISLRYFNPIGAHESGAIGENPADVPNNLFPFITQVAVGRRDHLNVFGSDWPTVDGTGVRDYVHVVDLALGHVRALQYAAAHRGFDAINLGTGRGTSVLELVHAFEAATGVPIPLHLAPRRPGDIAECWADPTRANQLLDWRAERDVQRACADGWRWQKSNPQGYG